VDLGEVGWGDVDWIGLAKDRSQGDTIAKSTLCGLALIATQNDCYQESYKILSSKMYYRY
jgi:hypothetical protein